MDVGLSGGLGEGTAQIREAGDSHTSLAGGTWIHVQRKHKSAGNE